jgi:hypothetical protein
VTLGQVYKSLAVFFATLAAIAAFFFFRLKWSRGTDFDLTGFFWLMANIGRLTLLLLVLICAATALSYWIRASRVS